MVALEDHRDARPRDGHPPMGHDRAEDADLEGTVDRHEIGRAG
jgi:hypothetical protein